MTDLQTKFHTLESDLNTVLIERPEVIHSVILALVAKRHLFMLGSPGVAKSMVVDELAARIDGLDNDTYFKWLLTKSSVPEELYGGPDFTLMREKGIYKRVTAGKLPVAVIAFLDEIFKGSSAILNTLLMILNENEFENPGDDPHVPLLSMFAASNELPASAELNALADRLHFWHYVEPIADPSNFAKMLSMELPEPVKSVSLDDIYEAQREIADVVIGDDVLEILVDLARKLRDEGIFVSDRRFRQSMDVIRAEAWLHGKEQAEVVDTKPLVHMFWMDPSQITVVRKAVLDLADPIEREVLDLRDEIEGVYEQFNREVADADSNTVRAQCAIQAYQKFTKAKDEWKVLRDRQAETGRDMSPALISLRDRLRELAPLLLERGLQFKSDTKALDMGMEDEL